MDTTTTQNTNAATTDQVPAAIGSFTDAHAARDADAALALLAPGAMISDVGESFTGEEALRHFVRDAGAEFTYTEDITGIRLDGETWVVGHHLEGDFPGGTADLDYRFTLVGGLIERIDIVLG